MPVILADWATWFQANFDGTLIMCLSIVCIPLVLGLVFGVAHFWFPLRTTQIEAVLKQQMIASGMSADEIERVLAAKIDSKPKKTKSPEKQTAPYPNVGAK
jgi:hypothetical protein